MEELSYHRQRHPSLPPPALHDLQQTHWSVRYLLQAPALLACEAVVLVQLVLEAHLGCCLCPVET